MKRPMTLIALSFIMGIMLGRYISVLEIIALLLFCAVGVAVYFKVKMKTWFVFVVPFFIAMGIMSFNANNSDIVKYSEKVVIHGFVEETSFTKKGKQSLVLRVDNMNDVTDISYSVKVYIQDNAFFKVGDYIKIEGYLNEPKFPSNDGEFNNFAYLKSNGYDYTLTGANAEKLGETSLSFVQKMGLFREKINNVYDEIYPDNEGAIIKAMVTGDTYSLSDDLRALYANSGISHILAISGLHMAIVAGMLIWILNACGMNKRRSGIITVVFLILYTIFTGGKIAATRSVIMISVMILGRLFYRKSDTINSLGVSAFVILVINPWQLWDIGFQLSFVSVLSLATLGVMSKSKNEVIASLKASFWASTATLPIVAWNFYTVPLLGCFVNILVLPLTGFVVGLSMVSGLVGLISIEGGMLFGSTAYIILKFYEFVCKFFTAIPFSTILIGRPHIVAVVAFYGILIAIYFGKYKKVLITSFTMVILTVMLSNRLVYKVNSVDFLYVGQGDCAILRTYDNKAYIFDTGGYGYREIGDNTGINTIIPYLKSHGISDIETIYISHMDADYMLGAIELLSEYKVKRVVMSDYDWKDQTLYMKVVEEAKNSGAQIQLMSGGDMENISGGFKVSCYYPFKDRNIKGGSDNSGSLVLKLEKDETSFLFTGDIGFGEEKNLLDFDIGADVLKVAHHGSKYSSGVDFLEQVDMKYAVISSGERNTYGHPSEEALERLENTEVYSTAENGTISFKTTGEKLWVKTKR